jgi:hypothetical protein
LPFAFSAAGQTRTAHPGLTAAAVGPGLGVLNGDILLRIHNNTLSIYLIRIYKYSQ